jgi:hypothetical protein
MTEAIATATAPLDFARLTVLEKLSLVEEKLKEADPMLGHHMTEIHKTLLANEELVHILPADRIHILMAGMQKYKQIQLVEAAAKKPSSKKVKQSEDDF